MNDRLKAFAGSLAVLVVLLVSAAAGADDAWVTLFDGKSTAGWVQRGGKAVYTVEDGALVGRTVLGEPNSFLCPPKEYADFVLEFEVWVDPKVNSGVQVRSASRPDYRNGVVHGYQIEIDPSERAWSGGIYDEQRRGWLQNPKDDPAARKAFKAGEWNRYRVEAAGDRLRTWVNDVPVVRPRRRDDPLRLRRLPGPPGQGSGPRGQVAQHPHQGATPGGHRPLPQHPHRRRARRGLAAPLDGHTTWGWRSAKGQAFPKEGWEIQDGVLSVVETGGAESRAGGDIVTDEAFSAFDLKFEFRLTPGANSGVKYYVDTELNKGEGSAIGLEFQLLDDATHPDAKLGRDGNRTLGSLYDLIPAAAGKKVKPIGEWNEARVVSDGRHVEHWVNGAKVLEYERGSEEFRRLVAMSKYKVWPGFGERPSGPILLQDHGNRVSFRNLKIRKQKQP